MCFLWDKWVPCFPFPHAMQGVWEAAALQELGVGFDIDALCARFSLIDALQIALWALN
jgi:hypothetical protein